MRPERSGTPRPETLSARPMATAVTWAVAWAYWPGAAGPVAVDAAGADARDVEGRGVERFADGFADVAAAGVQHDPYALGFVHGEVEDVGDALAAEQHLERLAQQNPDVVIGAVDHIKEALIRREREPGGGAGETVAVHGNQTHQRRPRRRARRSCC